jgi:hypothetical protein
MFEYAPALSEFIALISVNLSADKPIVEYSSKKSSQEVKTRLNVSKLTNNPLILNFYIFSISLKF